eukprot:scaffold648213_cov55-Attheya_sp.AAC.2
MASQHLHFGACWHPLMKLMKQSSMLTSTRMTNYPAPANFRIFNIDGVTHCFAADMGYHKNRVGEFSREDKSVWLLAIKRRRRTGRFILRLLSQDPKTKDRP